MKHPFQIAAMLAAICFSHTAIAQSSTRSAEATWRVHGVSSLFKLTATAPRKIEAFPSAPIHLRAARGEWSCFQVVVSSADKPLKNVQLNATSFATHLGEFITRDNIEIYRQHFVPVRTPSGNRVLERKLWSDALFPISTQKQIDIAPRSSEAFWIAVKTPDDAAPGDYFSGIEVGAEGETMRELPIILSVSKAQLPAPTLRANVAVYYDTLRDWYTKNIGAPSDEEWNTQKKRYYQFLLAYRLNAYDLPVAWSSEEADTFLRDHRVLSVRTPPLDSPDFDVALQKLNSSNALAKAYYYHIDEPPPERYDDVRQTTKRLRTHRIPHLVTIAPNNALRRDVDIWCPNIGDFFGIGHLDHRVLEAERKAGRGTWWYTMVEPKYSYPTWLLDDDASAISIYGWMMARWQIGGFVYSMAHGWGPKPLENLESFAATNGDGTLLYPSEVVGGVGPMPSIRLMLLRDAIEDYELLKSLSQKQQEQLFEYSKLDFDLTFPLQKRRAWEKNYSNLRLKLLGLASGESVSSPKTLQPQRSSVTTLQIGKSSEVPRVKVAPQLDAKLSDRAWNDMSLWRGHFVRVENDAIKVPTTRLWLCHDERFLYVAVRAQHEQRAAKIVVEIAPQNASERWRFVTLGDGTQRTEHHTREGHFLIQSADVRIVRQTLREHSVVEMRVPLSLVGNATRFRFNALRRVWFPASQMFYTAKAALDADDTTKMPFVRLTRGVRQ